MKANEIIGGAGAIEMELSKILRDYSRTVKGAQQIVISAFAKSLEVIPRTLANNAGLDSVCVLIKLRKKHANLKNGKWFGVDINNKSGICDAYQKFIWEPMIVRMNALIAATEVIPFLFFEFLGCLHNPLD